MVDFGTSIVNWFVINKDSILLFLTSTSFIGFVTAVILFIKQILAIKAGNKNVKDLSETLAEIAKLENDINGIKNDSNKLISDVDELYGEIVVLENTYSDNMDIMLQKVNGMIDALQISYSMIRDERARKDISDILRSTKLIETSTKVALEKEIEELKATIASGVNNIQTKVVETENKIKKSTEPKKSTSRY